MVEVTGVNCFRLIFYEPLITENFVFDSRAVVCYFLRNSVMFITMQYVYIYFLTIPNT